MNWARDDARITGPDFKNVFRYHEESSATVMTLLSGERGPLVEELTDCDWEKMSRPADLEARLAKSGNPSRRLPQKSISNDFTENVITNTGAGGQRDLRKVPFSESTFRKITHSFFTHGSFSSVVSRADVPVFSHAEVNMKDVRGQIHLAHVYNCRSSNTWEKDLAVTVTYLPHSQKIFCIMLGCDDTIEANVRDRLMGAGNELFYPLLVPGILVELERSRHVKIIDRSIGAMETKIAELDSIADQMDEEFGSHAAEQRNSERRTAWLDTAYLKTGLISWNAQLEKFRRCVTALDETFAAMEASFSSAQSFEMKPWKEIGLVGTGSRPHITKPISPPVSEIDFAGTGDDIKTCPEPASTEFLRGTGEKMRKRIEAIEEEYGHKIRDCTMRLDGMSMATQWAQGETNMAIAMATSRDSKHMRFIAIVTMVFLPGTFFASIFSMSFFNWQDKTTAVISSFFWVYVLFTVTCTLLTLGLWWYFVICRPKQIRKRQSDELSMV
ncbi:hypothetical protein PG996_000102 [Apiospora saccharicola]|uniref:Uncharacterized protein n=1 Tax=Apiospora saccharicola TaxID=335842 RepID=A0ABR1WFN1_9PEZI